MHETLYRDLTFVAKVPHMATGSFSLSCYRHMAIYYFSHMD